MARFEFKLDPVLRHRRMIEEQCQRDLAQLLRRQMILQSQITSLQETIVADKRSMAGALVGQVNVDRIRQHGVHSNHIAVRVQKVAIELLKLRGKIEQAREKLLTATKARKAVELLRNKRYERWMTEQRRAETREADEMATQAYARRMAHQADEVGAVA